MDLHPPKPGMTVTPNVQLVRLLGQGGMGSVWVADHLTLETQVAVKFVTPEVRDEGGKSVLARFKREATAAAKIKSPHVVQTYDHGVMDDGTPYIIMELLEGESLAAHLARNGHFTVANAALILRQIANALTDAHRLGIVHRDIKPDNIFLTKSADQLFVKVLDFGIAKQRSLPSLDVITRTGMMVGTPYYMSPEQITSSKEVDHRADLWALAVVAYEMVTARLPFDGETMGALIVAITSAKFELPSRLGVAHATDNWFARAFAQDADPRFTSAREMADAFETVVKATSATSPPRSATLANADTVATPPRATPLEAALETSPTPGGRRRGQPLVYRILVAGAVAMALGTVAVLSQTVSSSDTRSEPEPAQASEPAPNTSIVAVTPTVPSGEAARDVVSSAPSSLHVDGEAQMSPSTLPISSLPSLPRSAPITGAEAQPPTSAADSMVTGKTCVALLDVCRACKNSSAKDSCFQTADASADAICASSFRQIEDRCRHGTGSLGPKCMALKRIVDTCKQPTSKYTYDGYVQAGEEHLCQVGLRGAEKECKHGPGDLGPQCTDLMNMCKGCTSPYCLAARPGIEQTCAIYITSYADQVKLSCANAVSP